MCFVEKGGVGAHKDGRVWGGVVERTVESDDAEDETERQHEYDDRVDFESGGFVRVES